MILLSPLRIRCTRGLGVLLGMLLLAAGTTPLAHTPHDDIFDVELSPGGGRNGTMFIIVRGNLLRSRDAGTTWKRLQRGLDHRHLPVSLGISPASPSDLFLATLGDGIYKSEDGGDSWSRIDPGPETRYLDLVVAHPEEPGLVLAAGATRGLYRTTDGGRSWSRVAAPDAKVTAIDFAAGAPSRIFAGDHHGGLWVSDDGGAQWTRLSTANGSQAITALAVSAGTETDVTVMLGTSDGRISKSTDGGRRFDEVHRAEEGAITGLAVSPRFAMDGTVWASTADQGALCSRDGGESWIECRRGLTRHSQAPRLGRPHFGSIRVAENHAADRTLFLAGYDGLFRSTDGGERWREVTTLTGSTIVGLGLSPAFEDDATVAVTTYMWGALLSENGGRDWRPINANAEDYARPRGLTRLFNVVFSPHYAADRTLFSSTWYRFLKSTNAGSHWRQILPSDADEWTSLHHGMTVAVSPVFAEDGTLYVGTSRGQFFESTDRGESFLLIAEIEDPVNSLVVSPDFARDRTLFAGTPTTIYRTADGGRTWRVVARAPPPEGDAGTWRAEEALSPVFSGEQAQNWRTHLESMERRTAAVALSISPAYAQDRTVFAATSSGVLATTDGGETWRRLPGEAYGGDSKIEAIAVSPDYARDRTVIVSARGRGLFRSEDGGQSFAPIGGGLLRDQQIPANFDGFPQPLAPPLVLSPSFATDRTAYAFSDHELLISKDAGDSWSRLEVPGPTALTRAYVSYRHHSQRYGNVVRRYLRSRKFLAAVGATLLVTLSLGFLLRRREAPTPRSEEAQVSPRLGDWKTLACAPALFLGFYALYVALGTALILKYPSYEFLGMDHWEWIGKEWADYHKGAHPLLMLFLQPFRLVISLFPAIHASLLAVLLNALFGAAGVSLAFLVFRAVVRRIVVAGLLAILFGLTTSQLVFGSVPESYALAACSVIFTYLVFVRSLQRRELPRPTWLLAGLLSFGVTFTNFAQTIFAFAGTVLSIRQQSPLRAVLRYVVLVVAVCAVLALVQRAAVPRSKLFFLPETIERETSYTLEYGFRPVKIGKNLVSQFFLTNVLASDLIVGRTRSLSTGTGTTAQTTRYIPLGVKTLDVRGLRGLAGAVLWSALLLAGFFYNLRDAAADRRSRLYLGVLVCAVSFNLLLHSIYGTSEIFVHSANFTFPVLLLATNRRLLDHFLGRACLAALVVIVAMNNLDFILEILAS
ncbi:MAG: DUF6080 domain-containing protein [Acidobacteriota bacterium]|nr:DUF6080 domain-containing protein [Acidobacteriota bacterium]